MPDALSPIYGLVEPELSSTGWGPKINADMQVLDTLIAYPHVQRKALTIGATTTLNLTEGIVFLLTLTQDTTIAFYGVAADTTTHKPAQRILLAITADGTARTITWDTSIYWLVGEEPVLPATGTILIEMFTADNGTTWGAVHVGGFEGLPSDSVSTSKLQNLAVTTAKLADDAVTTVKILDGAVTAPKLAIGAVPRSSFGIPQAAKVGAQTGQTFLAEGTVNWVNPAIDDSTPAMWNAGFITQLKPTAATYKRRFMLMAQIGSTNTENQNMSAKILRDGVAIGWNGRSVDDEGNGKMGNPKIQVVAYDFVDIGAAPVYTVKAQIGVEGDHGLDAPNSWFAAIEMS